jgi:hypothetical protein
MSGWGLGRVKTQAPAALLRSAHFRVVPEATWARPLPLPVEVVAYIGVAVGWIIPQATVKWKKTD